MGGGGMHKTHKNNNISNKSPSGSWSMSSSSIIDSNRSTIPVPDCNCGLRTAMFKVNTTKNLGRPFYTCPFHKNDPRNCGYFIWFDEWEEILGAIVLKLGSVIDSAGVLGHWVNGRTTESLVEPHD
ncbi:GRF zinc finger protein [Medicago truncatula]|uniref:GRF zinc finger protein n=1 Tax=Medicago truncatula TaxID=3880 RepID=G7IM83_MEDTR|nr:GRF zinc finger protein [Medicago truncatula]